MSEDVSERFAWHIRTVKSEFTAVSSMYCTSFTSIAHVVKFHSVVRATSSMLDADEATVGAKTSAISDEEKTLPKNV